MTYKACKRLIDMAIEKNAIDKPFVEDMTTKLDIFLLNNRITDSEYNKLVDLMSPDPKTEA